MADVSDIFYFFCSGTGKGESEGAGRGGRFFIENPTRGGVSRRGRGVGRVSAANWGFLGGGGGENVFFRCRNVHQVIRCMRKEGVNWFSRGTPPKLRFKIEIQVFIIEKDQLACGLSFGLVSQ